MDSWWGQQEVMNTEHSGQGQSPDFVITLLPPRPVVTHSDQGHCRGHSGYAGKPGSEFVRNTKV